MDLNRAREINKACISFRLCDFDDIQPAIEKLKDLSLLDMLKARALIQAKHFADENSIPLYCDDRLLAAIYVITHYRSCEPSEIDPIVSLPKSFLVHVKWENQDTEENEDE